MTKQLRIGLFLAVGLILVGSMGMTACTRVDSYEVAVKKNAITGEVADQIYAQGLYHAIFRDWTTYPRRELQFPDQGQSERLTALTSDQLTIAIDAAYRYRLVPDSVLNLYLTVGAMGDVHEFVYNTYRSAARDAVANIAAADILSRERAGIGEQIQTIMESRLTPRGIEVTDFFVRDIEPPPSIRQAIEQKLAREQQVQAEAYQTQVVEEQANQRRAEAEGIRDAQQTISESLAGESGQRYLYWRYIEALMEVGSGENNLVIAPTEGGVPVFVTPGGG
ncbi:MAG: prohibitin family protein [Longimicrobiales bacterium]|nr:prohibitin family protein [Longimicrobiales bacterium]